MATRTGLGYAAAGVIVAGSIIAATAATVGLRTEQASTPPAPSTLESALVRNAAPVIAVAAAQPAPPPAAVPAPQTAAPPAVQPFAVPAAQPLTVAASSPRREHDDDDDDEHEEDEHEEREALKKLLTSFRREHR